MLATVEGIAQLVLCFAPQESDSRAHAAAHGRAPWTGELFDELAASEVMRWEPYVGWRRSPYAGRHTNVDDRGIRRTLSSARPGANRAFFFGGSTMWGTGARDEATIPSLVGRATGWDARNYGEAGYVSTQERFLLELELQRGERPDLVVFYDGVNDVFAAYQTHSAGLPQNMATRIKEFNLTKNPRRLAREAFVGSVRESAVLRLARALVGSERDPAPLSPDVRDRLAVEIAKAYAENVKDVRALCHARGIRAEFFLQPVIFTKRVLAPDERPLAARHGWIRDLYLATYDRIRRSGCRAGMTWPTRSVSTRLRGSSTSATCPRPATMSLRPGFSRRRRKDAQPRSGASLAEAGRTALRRAGRVR